MTAKTTAERNKAWHQRKKAQGLRRVCEYVKPECVEELREFARELRQGKERK
jgi:hypothetical protein